MNQGPPEIIQLPNTLTEELCKKIIEDTRPKLTPAMVGRGKGRIMHPSRVADNCKYRTDTDWSLAIRQRAADLAGVDNLSYVEPVEVVRYVKGGCYYRHRDDAAGDRTHTLSIMIGNQFTGGELFFDQLGALYTDVPLGMGLFWINNNQMTHECRPITSGEKWILNVWINIFDQEDREASGQDPLGDPEVYKYADSPIIIPGVND